MNIYVGNVPYAATEEDLEKLFGEYGPVATATIIRDRDDGRSKGFGFVEMENQADGERAMEALDGHEMMGRPLKVNPARPREERRLSPRRNPSNNQTQRTHEPHKSSPNGYFHNPYTFVPTPPREEAIKQGGFAGDFNPLKHPCGKAHDLDHASLKDDLWTGHIPITLKTVTPLVLLKTEGESRPENKPYDVLDYIPESSLRGMLRSAYEVVTNSRFGCFRNDEQLAYRMEATEATRLIPTIVKKDTKTGELKAYFYTGSSHPTEEGPRKVNKTRKALTIEQIKEGAMYTALLPRYNKIRITLQGSDEEPKTGDEVYAEIVLCGSGSYRYWQTSRIWLKRNCPTKPNPGSVPNSWDARKPKPYKDSDGNHIIEVVEGRVLITNQNIDRKGNERIFFYDNPKSQQKINIDNHEKTWRTLIKNYWDAHSDDDIFDRKDMNDIPKKPWQVLKKNDDTKEYAWSPHLYHRGTQKDRWDREAHDASDLQDGDMAYARCKIDDRTGDIKDVIDLFPVMISRKLYQNSPKDLLDPSLQPAEKLDDLSPADRLFGWTPQGEGSDGGYKSRIRVVCDKSVQSDIVEDFSDDPLTLTILGKPKPAQGRFYVAEDKAGTPQSKGISKSEAGYTAGKGLRGRKHYWHHNGLEEENNADYWNPLGEDRIREYIHIGDKESLQTRSITGWIKPGTEFEVSLYVQNLQREEVGALLWLLTFNNKLKDEDEKYYFKLGYGKPLGFGSVTMEIDKARLKNGCLPLSTGEDWKGYYADLNACSPATLDVDGQSACIQEFQDSMVDAYDPIQSQRQTTPESQAQLIEQRFIKLSFIEGFKQVLKGPDSQYPIHYPRRNSEPNPEGKNYEWFMDNENGREHNEDGKTIALPAVTDKKGLPYNPSKPNPSKPRQRRSRR